MAEVHNQEEIIYQNLIDAKCSCEFAQKCLELEQLGLTEQMLSRLSEHRIWLLSEIHERQIALDCLDYLIYQVEKNQNKNKGD